MTTKIDSYILPNKVIEKMKEQIDKTMSTGTEHAFSLCSKTDNIIVDRKHCEGERCQMTMEIGCEKDEELVGFYHTHPHSSDAQISPGDIKVICEAGKEKNGEIVPIRLIACVGSPTGNKINCFIKKTFPPELDKKMAISCVEEAAECHNTIIVPMDKRERELAEERLKINEELLSIQKKRNGRISEDLRKRYYNHMADVEKFIKGDKKSEERLNKLRDKYFDTINIS